jgi:hypothetical protein
MILFYRESSLAGSGRIPELLAEAVWEFPDKLDAYYANPSRSYCPTGACSLLRAWF